MSKQTIRLINDGYITGIPKQLYDLIIWIILTKFRKNIWIPRGEICNIILSMKDDFPFYIKNKYQLNGNLSHLCKYNLKDQKNGLYFKRIYNEKRTRSVWFYLLK